MMNISSDDSKSMGVLEPFRDSSVFKNDSSSQPEASLALQVTFGEVQPSAPLSAYNQLGTFPIWQLFNLPVFGNWSESENRTMNNMSATDAPVEPDMAIFLTLTGTSLSMVVACFILIFVTVAGNTLVILAFRYEPALQVITNHWIVSLAFTEIILALAVMPLQISREVFGGKWMFGQVACDLFICLDVLCCTCSIYHLCLISLDRYFCVRYPISYPRVRTRKATAAAIAGTWIWCMVMALPRLVGWKDKPREPFECTMTSVEYMLFSSAVSFYVPLLLTIVMYWGIYKVTRAQARKFACFSASFRLDSRHCLMTEPTAEGFVSSALITTTLDAAITVARASDDSRSSEPDEGVASSTGTLHLHNSCSANDFGAVALNSTPRKPSVCRKQSSLVAALQRSLSRHGAAMLQQTELLRANTAPLSPDKHTVQEKPPLQASKSDASLGQRVVSSVMLERKSKGRAPRPLVSMPSYITDMNKRRERLNRVRLTRRRQKQESRAAKVVVIVLAAFVLLWAPFFIVNVLAPLCTSCTISEDVWKLVTWLGYCNSCINPFIYTCFNRTFRRAMAGVLKKCCCLS